MLAGWVFRDPFQKLIDEHGEQAANYPTGCWISEAEWPYPVAD